MRLIKRIIEIFESQAIRILLMIINKLMALIEEKDTIFKKNRQLLVEFDSMSKKLVHLNKK